MTVNHHLNVHNVLTRCFAESVPLIEGFQLLFWPAFTQEVVNVSNK